MNNSGLAKLSFSKKLLAVVLVVALVAAGLAVWSSSRKASNDTTASQPSGTDQSNETVANSGGTFDYTFKDLGFKATLPDSFKGLTTKTDRAAGTSFVVVRLQVPSYTALANKCIGAPANKAQSFASLAKTPGSGASLPKGSPKPVKTFKSFYITNFGSSVSAAATCKDFTTQRQFKALVTQLQSDLQTALASAQQV